MSHWWGVTQVWSVLFFALALIFFWFGMRRDVKEFVQKCITCQTIKYSPASPYGLLQPLEMPERAWEDVAMDFIVGLPKSNGVTNIVVVVDRFTKYAHFGALPNPYTACKVAELFSNMVIRLHGVPRTIVSDRDPVFTSAFWKKIFELMGTKLKMSSAYHPQTDGQTEVTNRYLEQYLRAFTTENPKQWSKYLQWAEYHYNTSFHSSIQMTPFQAVYGRPPPTIPAYIRGSTTIQAVEEELLSRDAILNRLKDSLAQARHRMVQQANKHRRDRQFKIGDWVLVKLQPFRQTTVAHRLNSKLSRRYFGPFEVIGCAGPVAYTLQLPQTSRIHPTFHVSLLKPYFGPTPATCFPLPELSIGNKPIMLPLAILATRIQQLPNKEQRQVLVQWSLSTPEDATWENFEEFMDMYKLPNLADKVRFDGGGSVTQAQLPSPIEVDSGVAQDRMEEWLEEAAQDIQERMEPTSSKEVNILPEQAEREASDNAEERDEARTARRRVKPRWMKDFVGHFGR